jgi:hypothetical protein
VIGGTLLALPISVHRVVGGEDFLEGSVVEGDIAPEADRFIIFLRAVTFQ